ncbi:hypothetical protein [uncultured Algoriphagus sp.]|uniref:hypothetical protein n=1 Tax=uncultured Algoriphagus sp. TaxID=417365 RepID=UPI0030EC4B05|tara:strand:- start:5612 stop:6085 length:474 start_codon:yes stop_codon:yes gene_type:complete
MKSICIFCLFGVFLLMNGCVEDLEKETDELTGRWENSFPDPDDSTSVLVLYYVMKSDATLEEGYLKRNLQSGEEGYLFLATSEYATKDGFIEFSDYTTFRSESESGNLEYIPKEELVRYGTPMSRKMSYKLLENNQVLSVYQGCPADFCYDVLYDKL